MGKNSGKRVSRRLVETFKGFDIVRVSIEYYYKSLYSDCYNTSLIEKRERYYEFCKEGEYNRPSQAYSASAKSVEELKEKIKNFIKDDTLYFTEEEREKYIYKPNRKCDYAYGYESLMKVLKEHKKADKRIKILIEDRLEDANFRLYSGLLNEGKYEQYEKDAADEFRFNEKFEVYTRTMRKPIKDPKSLEEGINKAISQYLASQGIKDTSVEVKFCEEW